MPWEREKRGERREREKRGEKREREREKRRERQRKERQRTSQVSGDSVNNPTSRQAASAD